MRSFLVENRIFVFDFNGNIKKLRLDVRCLWPDISILNMCLVWLHVAACQGYELVRQYDVNTNFPMVISKQLDKGEAFRIEWKNNNGVFLVVTSSLKFYMNIKGYWNSKMREFNAEEPGLYVFNHNLWGAPSVEYVAVEAGVHTVVASNVGQNLACDTIIAKDKINRYVDMDYVGRYCYIQTDLNYPITVASEGIIGSSQSFDFVGLNKSDGSYAHYTKEDPWYGTLSADNVIVARVRQNNKGYRVPVTLSSGGSNIRNFGTHDRNDMVVSDSQPPFYWNDNTDTKKLISQGQYVPPPDPTKSPTASRSPSASPSPSQSPTASASPSMSRSPTASASPSMSQSPLPTETRSKSPTASASPSMSIATQSRNPAPEVDPPYVPDDNKDLAPSPSASNGEPEEEAEMGAGEIAGASVGGCAGVLGIGALLMKNMDKIKELISKLLGNEEKKEQTQEVRQYSNNGNFTCVCCGSAAVPNTNVPQMRDYRNPGDIAAGNMSAPETANSVAETAPTTTGEANDICEP